MKPRLYLGVDGGQSSTIALIGDVSGRIAGIGHSGACGEIGAIAQSVREAMKAAGMTGGFEVACFGLSGGTAGREASLRAVAEASHYVITHDAAIALTGALAGEPGIVVIAGTGSIAFGRNSSGSSARAGGWGYLFGDEGGAFDVVRQALRAALRQEEGWGSRTALRELLLAETGSQDVNDLLHRFYTVEWPRNRVASLAPLLDQAAQDGDAIAQEILRSAGQALAALTGIVRGQLFKPGDAVKISYAGGVFQSLPLRGRFHMLAELEDGNQVQAPRYGGLYGPAAGALIEAYRGAGLTCLPVEVPLEKS